MQTIYMQTIMNLEAMPFGDQCAFSYSTERGEREDYDFRVEFHEGASEDEEKTIINLIEAAPAMFAALKTADLQLQEYVTWHHKNAGGCSIEMEYA